MAHNDEKAQRSYFTVQMSQSAPGGAHCIHLGRDDETGGLGDNICGNSRHARSPQSGSKYGFSCAGGSTDPDAWACEGCKTIIRLNPGTVRGMFSTLFDGISTPTGSSSDGGAS
jgi:hypothetical protein